jgi:hypothetical protein
MMDGRGRTAFCNVDRDHFVLIPFFSCVCPGRIKLVSECLTGKVVRHVQQALIRQRKERRLMTAVYLAGPGPSSLLQELAMLGFAYSVVQGHIRQVRGWLTIRAVLFVGLERIRQGLERDRPTVVCNARAEHSCHTVVQSMCQTAPGVMQAPTRLGRRRSMDVLRADRVRIRLGRV